MRYLGELLGTYKLKTLVLLMFALYLTGCGKIWGSSELSIESQVPNPAVGPNPSPVPVCHKSLGKLAIYYSYASSLNYPTNSFTASLAAADLAQYDLVILGTGNEVDGSGPNVSLDPVLALFPQPRSTKFYGYLKVGEVSASYLSAPQMEAVIDDIQTAGFDGVIFDTVGFDYKPSGFTDAQMRQRTIDIAAYAHSKNLNIMYNAWDMDDLFVKESSLPLTFSSGDKILIESFGLGFNSFAQLTYSDFKVRIQKLAAAKLAHPDIEFWGMPTVANISDFSQAKYDAVVYLAMLFGLNGIGWSEPGYSTGVSEALLPARARVADANDFCEVLDFTETAVDANTETLSFELNSKAVEITYTKSGAATTVTVQ